MKALLIAAVALFTAVAFCRADDSRKESLCGTKFFAEIPLSTTYANGNMWTGWAGRWTDSLLLVNRTAGFPSDIYYRVTTDSMLTTLSDIASYMLDGAVFNCDRPALIDRIDEMRMRGGAPCMYVGSLQPRSFDPSHRDFNRSLGAFKRSISNPYAWYAPDGRQIFISYWTDRHHTPEQLAAWLREYREKFGDFIFIADVSAIGYSKWRNGPESAMKDYIRNYLRVADGIYFGEYIACAKSVDGERIFDEDIYRDIILKRIRDVINEPEFTIRKKYLGLAAGVGHGNPTTFGNILGQDGTRTLRRTFAADMALNPDFINFFEWDEWNENTLIKPSVWNSFAEKRLLRSLISSAKSEPNNPLPGDDRSVPNIVLSYRKISVPGNVAVFEILSIPETGVKGIAEVSLRLARPDGTVVREFDSFTIGLESMEERRLHCPSEIWASEAVLMPEVTVTGPKCICRFITGLPQIEVVPGGSSDHKWATVSLRDVAHPASCDLAAEPVEGIGIYRATVHAHSVEEIDRVEIAVNGALVFSKGGNFDDFRMADGFDVFSITQFAKKYTDVPRETLGFPWLSVEGVSSAEWRYAGKTVKGNKLTFYDQGNYTPDIYLRLPHAATADAVLKLDWPAIGEHREVRLADVLASDSWAVTGADGFTFAVSRFYGFNEYGTPSGTNILQASALVRADRRVSVISAYLITKSGKTLRSRPVVVGDLGESVKRHVYSATMEAPVEISLGENRQPTLAYDFVKHSGGIVPSGVGCSYDGTLGAIPYVACHRNRNGASFFGACPNDWANKPSRAPEVVESNGVASLSFVGDGTFFSIPWGAISSYGAFRLSFEFNPDDIMRDQEIFATGSGRMYGAVGFIRLKGGMISSLICGMYDNDTKLSVGIAKQGEWNSLSLEWNIDTAELVLNGISSGKVPCVRPLRFDCASWFGGRKGAFFKGMLRNVRIDYR